MQLSEFSNLHQEGTFYYLQKFDYDSNKRW